MAVWVISICQASIAQDRSDYIESYKTIAVSEMIRTGIPASIKLAQAMLESDCGKSDLACKANNHFGIKCGNDWNGKSYKKEDDDYENGKLVKSCFREFRSVHESYIEHSEFLMDPNKARRYGFLFELEPDDYKGWAKGLSKAGYATDPKYADRLIELIERYDLHQYDGPSREGLAVKHSRSHKPSESLGHKILLYHNDVKYAIALEGDTPGSLASRNDVTPGQIVRYNDDIGNEDQILSAGSRVYLQPKRNQNHGREKTHLLKPGEDLVFVSQKYAVKLEALLKRNGLYENEIPAPNQKIVLKGKAKKPLRTIDPYKIPDNTPMEKTEMVALNKNIHVTQKNKIEPQKTISVSNDSHELADMEKMQHASVNLPSISSEKPKNSPAVEKKPIPPVTDAASFHVVAKSETLYSISRLHGISLAELKKLNNLSADTIFIGQKLLLK